MAEQSSVRRPDRPLPGTVKPARFRPRFHWELLACGTRGHELVGLDAARFREEDRLFAFVVNVAIVVYLLYAKRLFGFRGGAAAEEADREHDIGWHALERSPPWALSAPGRSAGSAAR